MTPEGQLSSAEFQKTIRDLVIVALSSLIPEILETAGTVDFGEYQILATMIIAGLTTLANRYFNVIRPQ